jgi:hypothetical protein
MQTNRRRFAIAWTTVFVVLLSILILTWGPPAQGSHIPGTGPLPSNCVEFQVNTLGTKSPSAFPGVDITVNSWDNGSESHSLSFTIAGLTDGQYVELSVKSGTTVQEPGPYGNGTHTYRNGLQNAISHIRLCVFQETTTTTTTEATTTTTEATTTTTGGSTTTTEGSTTTTEQQTTTTEPGESTTTTDPGETTTTTDPLTTTTDEVLGTTITSPSTTVDPGTVPDEVLGTTIVAGDLPFTGVEATTLGGIALSLLALGTLVLLGLRSFRGRSDTKS